MIKITDENINNAMERINKVKYLDINSPSEDERIAQMLILAITEGFNEGVRVSGRKKK